MLANVSSYMFHFSSLMAMSKVATSFPAAGLTTGETALATVANGMYLLPTPHLLGTLAQRPGFNANTDELDKL